MPALAGRQRELEAVEAFLADLAEGPAALVLEGPAGIGKTAVWEAGRVAALASATVLAARPSIAEQELPWSGLNDLLASIDLGAAAAHLPEPQRRAIDIVLGRREPDGGPVDDLVIGLAVQGLLQHVAEDRPIVLAIDDLQWLDAPSRAVVGFVLRRLGKARVGLLATVRSGSPLGPGSEGDGSAPADPVLDAVRERPAARLALGPLGDDAIGSIVRQHVGTTLSRPSLDRVCESSGGNPLYAIELARAAAGSPDRTTTAVRAAVDDLEAIVRERVAGLSPDARELLLAVASAGRLTWEQAATVAGDINAERAFEAVQREGLLRGRGELVEYTHPLLAAIVYEGAAEPHRRRLHRRFAELWPEGDDAPRHLGLGAAGPDERIAATLDGAAKRTRLRGAPSIAAGLHEQAARLTPLGDAEARDQRLIDAAMAHFAGGDTKRARELLEGVATATDGPRHAQASQQLAYVIWAADGDRAGTEAFERALSAAAGNAAIEGDIHDNLAWLTCWLGDMPRAYEHIQIARETAERTGDPALLARVYDKVGQIEFQIGRDPGLVASARAMELERATGGGVGEAALNETILLTWADSFDEARARLDGYYERAIRDGDERLRMECLQRFGLIDLRAGRWTQARIDLLAAREIGAAAGLALSPVGRTIAMLDAHEGRLDEARATVVEGLPPARRDGAAWSIIRYLGIAGFADLSAGDVEHAADTLDEADRLCEQIGVQEPGIFRTQADTVEALIGAGRLARAETVLARFERQSLQVQRPWGLAAAARDRALLQATLGESEAAAETIIEALGRSAVLGQPFEHARTLLVAGTIDRRAGRRREARGRLTEAAELFATLGAPLWADRARTELARISGRAPGGSDLTAAEEGVAALVAEGLTNQEVAARLFVSVRTVETNLTRIYQKLDVRSRTELARRLAGASIPNS